MLKIGWLSTYNTRCGISEYSRYLVDALRRRDDVDVTVFGSKNYDEYKVEEDQEYVLPTFAVLPWNKYGDHSFDVDTILESEPEVLHIQYEVLLYNQEGLASLLQRYSGLRVITYHDNCIPPNFPYHSFDLQYTHRDDVGVGEGFILPMGVEDRVPVVKTFGLGRSRKDIIESICDRNGWNFAYSFGEEDWVDQESLYSWLRDSDLIVLYYDDAAAAGTSIAARVAISTRRPVIVNKTTWFKDLYQDIIYSPNLYVANGESQLEITMRAVLINRYIEENSWDTIANTLVEDYQHALAAA